MQQSADRALVTQLKAFSAEGRDRIEKCHRFGLGGIEIVEEYTRLADNVVQQIYEDGIQREMLPENAPLTILALGGYGRAELNPYSDIDVMLVYDDSKISIGELESFANHLIAVLWDVGYEVGHSCRSVKECIRATYEDFVSKTSFIESRYIVGAKDVHKQLLRQIAKHVYRRQINRFITQAIEEWKERHESHGSTIYLQEPDIKESVGGLRDFHTAIWITAVKYGIKDLHLLSKRNIISPSVAEASRASLDFLWWLRNELHYVTKRKTDKLSFEVQQTIAKNLGYSDEGSILAEEAMMRDYYLRAEHLSEFTSLIIDLVKDKEWTGSRALKLLRSIKLSNGFLISDREISFQPGQSDFSIYPTRIMRLFVHMQQLGCRISNNVKHAVVANLHLIDDEFQRTRANGEAFLSILGHSTRVSKTLREMHRLEVLDCYLPEFSKIRSLVRYDRPHQYTVDEHTMYAIENLEKQTLAEMKDGQAFIEMLNSLAKPELLRLAVLYHDVGKGIEGPGDHDQRSVEAAKLMLDRLSLSDDDRQTVLFLISSHLDMSHTAQHRDLDDPKTIEQFAKLIGNEQNAKMLYLLTFADMCAVSTNIWTEWSATLLRSLYDRTIKYLRGEPYRIELDNLHKQVNDLIGKTVGETAIQRHFDMMPEQQLVGNTPAFICKQIELIEKLGDKPIAVACFQDTQFHTQIGICTRDNRGSFHQITGVIAAQKANILSADIETRGDGVVIDTISLSDETTRSGLSAEHRDRVVEALDSIWQGKTDVEAVLQDQEDTCPPSTGRRKMPLEVVFDNGGSDLATIIDIRSQDRVGLLYSISDVFYNLNVDVRIARITTEGFTVMDTFYVEDVTEREVTKANRIEEIKNTFYVTEADGGKITNLDRIEEIKKALTNRLSAG